MLTKIEHVDLGIHTNLATAHAAMANWCSSHLAEFSKEMNYHLSTCAPAKKDPWEKDLWVVGTIETYYVRNGRKYVRQFVFTVVHPKPKDEGEEDESDQESTNILG